jgi:hypothetical protein
MELTIVLNQQAINHLDLSPAKKVLEQLPLDKEIATYEQKLQFKINYERDNNDPREISEIPEIRLWFVRLDAAYPWLPFLLNWRNGELVRYGAMLVPHQFNRSEGIIYNPEALEIFVMHKTFILAEWLKQREIPSQFRLKSMAQMFGYDLEDSFFELLN